MSAKEKQPAQSEQPKTISLNLSQYDEIYECAGALSELAFLCKKASEGEEFPGRALETIYHRLADVFEETQEQRMQIDEENS
jgi:hypothetical protein